jgi:hypothetical protein
VSGSVEAQHVDLPSLRAVGVEPVMGSVEQRRCVEEDEAVASAALLDGGAEPLVERGQRIGRPIEILPERREQDDDLRSGTAAGPPQEVEERLDPVEDDGLLVLRLDAADRLGPVDGRRRRRRSGAGCGAPVLPGATARRRAPATRGSPPGRG